MNGLRPILLVEDNPLDVDLAVRAFKKSMLTNPILVARDGTEALAWLPRWEAGEAWPVVILLDLKMPGIGGIEVLREIKAHPVLRVIPIVILSISRVGSDLDSAYAAGANSYIVKTVNFDEFMDVAQQIEQYWTVINEPPTISGKPARPGEMNRA